MSNLIDKRGKGGNSSCKNESNKIQFCKNQSSFQSRIFRIENSTHTMWNENNKHDMAQELSTNALSIHQNLKIQISLTVTNITPSPTSICQWLLINTAHY